MESTKAKAKQHLIVSLDFIFPADTKKEKKKKKKKKQPSVAERGTCDTCKDIVSNILTVSMSSSVLIVYICLSIWPAKKRVFCNKAIVIQMSCHPSPFVSQLDVTTLLLLQGIDKTANKNFGGGNTKWEESKLGKYEYRYVCVCVSVCLRGGA